MPITIEQTTLMETQILEAGTDAGKEGLFDRVVNENLDGIYNYARYMVLDYDEAEDIAQKTFISLHRNLKKLDASVSLKPWLFKVARNHCLDYLKKKKALQFSQVEEQVLDVPENDIGLEQRLDDQLFMSKVKDLFRQLPVPMREVLALKYFEDLTLEQAAEALDQPLNTVKSNFYRGKAKLYQLLKD